VSVPVAEAEGGGVAVELALGEVDKVRHLVGVAVTVGVPESAGGGGTLGRGRRWGYGEENKAGRAHAAMCLVQ